MYKQILEKILTEGQHIDRGNKSLTSLYNFDLQLSKSTLNYYINEIPINRQLKFETELELFLGGTTSTKFYEYYNIKYWNYIGEYFINSYPQYYPKFLELKNNFKDNSKNHVLYFGNGEYSNQQACTSCIQFQKSNNNLYVSVLQRSSDANLGFLADLYHLKLLCNMLGNFENTNINILYGNLHIYDNNKLETLKYLNNNTSLSKFKFKQNN
jgi:thymidylate synthase